MVSRKQFSISAALSDALDKFCEKQGFMHGEEYYRVPDYNYAISFLLEEYLNNSEGENKKPARKKVRQKR